MVVGAGFTTTEFFVQSRADVNDGLPGVLGEVVCVVPVAGYDDGGPGTGAEENGFGGVFGQGFYDLIGNAGPLGVGRPLGDMEVYYVGWVVVARDDVKIGKSVPKEFLERRVVGEYEEGCKGDVVVRRATEAINVPLMGIRVVGLA